MTLDETTMQLLKDEGRIERDTYFVKNLFESTDFTDEKIAALAGVSPAFVEEKKKELYGYTHTLSKTEEIAILLMRELGEDVKKTLEQQAIFGALLDKTGDPPDISQISDEQLKAALQVHYLPKKS